MASGSGSQPPKRVKTSESCEEITYHPDTQKSLEEIDNCQQEIDALNEQAGEEILKIEQQYNKMRKPFYQKRTKLTQDIPYFWTTVLINHPQISGIIGKEDEDVLEYLIKLEVDEFEDIKFGYKITFYFNENPFFENDKISKEFYLDNKPVPKSKNTTIIWKGKDLSAKKDNKKQGECSRKRPSEKNSFFSWFSDHSDPCADGIAEVIKDDLWANPLQYYFAPTILEPTDVKSDSVLEEEDGDEDNGEEEVEEEQLSESEGAEEEEME